MSYSVGKMPPTTDLKSFITELANKHKVLVFSKTTCPFCYQVSNYCVIYYMGENFLTQMLEFSLLFLACLDRAGFNFPYHQASVFQNFQISPLILYCYTSSCIIWLRRFIHWQFPILNNWTELSKLLQRSFD